MLYLNSARLNLTALCATFVFSSAIAAPPSPSEAPTRAAWNPRYELIDVGSLGGLITTAQHVNDFGEVIGTSNTTDNVSQHAYLWRKGQMEDLGTLGGYNSQGIKVNDRGEAVGNALTEIYPDSSAFLYSNGQAQTLPFDIAYAVNLKKQVSAQQFREDLYYRLAVFPIHLPPLRERMSDLEDLATAFVTKFQPGLILSREALQILAQHTWPGNVRELRNAIERATILVGSGYEIKPEHIVL